MLQLAALGIIIVLLVISITRLNLHPFIALILAGLLTGIITGMPVATALESLLDGFAGTMRWIGIVIVLGTIIGEILFETGGSMRISGSMIKLTGKKRITLTMGMTGYVVAIPVFVDVAYIMLQSITEALAARTRRSILSLGLSLTAGLTATHALLPPTPGPLAAAGLANADLGKVILINLMVAVFVTAAGLLWARYYCNRIMLDYDRDLEKRYKSSTHQLDKKKLPTAAGSFLPILLPLVMIAAGSFSTGDPEKTLDQVLDIIGSPVIALLVGVFIAMLLLKNKKKGEGKLHRIIENSIKKAAVVLMITGAGGAFGGVIKESQLVDTISAVVSGSHIPGLLLPFLLAATLTTATGSLTVSMVTTASIFGPMASSIGLTPELIVALIGSGSLCVIHTNSSFFWLMSRLHNVPANILLKTLTIQSLLMGLAGLGGILLLRLFGIV